MQKPLTAEMLLNELLSMKATGFDLSRIQLTYRYDPDSDCEPVTYIGDGVFDAETNSILEELIFMTDASEYGEGNE